VTSVVKKITGHVVRVGGTQHSGWLPEGAATPLPTPARDVAFNIEIQFDGSGYLLCYASQAGDLHGDTWHETLEYAEEAAKDVFGVEPGQWRDV
jgi:hypothetical protein